MALGVGPTELGAPLMNELGGFNRPICRAIRAARAGHQRAAERIVERVRRETDAIRPTVGLADLGLPPELADLLPDVVAIAGESGSTSPYEIQEGVLSGRQPGPGMGAAAVVRLLAALSLLDPLPYAEGTDEEMRQYRINPLLASAAARRGAAA